MYFDEDEEKRLFEDLQFKRRVAFVDDDNIIKIELKSFSKISEKYQTSKITIYFYSQIDLMNVKFELHEIQIQLFEKVPIF